MSIHVPDRICLAIFYLFCYVNAISVPTLCSRDRYDRGSFREDRVTECSTLPRGIHQPPFESERQAEQEDRVIRSDYRTRLSGQLKSRKGNRRGCLIIKW